MHTGLPESLAAQVSDLLAARLGLSYPPERWPDLARGLTAAARAFRQASTEECARWLLATPLTRPQTETLASHLTVGETYFFRDRRAFEILEQRVLPELLRVRSQERNLRVWSAGCCTGEEPYSLAMLLDRVLPHPREWTVTILGTDINPEFLARAAAGVYGEWSFRDTPEWVRDGYFERLPAGRYAIRTSLREKVTFSYLNLAADPYPSLANGTNGMDLVFCRNVLMYFTAAQARRVVEGFHRSIVEGGWLVVGPAEASSDLFRPFRSVELEGTFFYRRDAEHEAGAAALPLRAERIDGLSGASAVATATVADLAETPDGSAALPIERAPLPAPVPPAATGNASAPGAPTADDGEALSRMARACANAGRLAEARVRCDQALTCDRLHPGYHYLSALIDEERGRRDAAARALRRALFLDPGFVLAHFALGNLHLALGQGVDAERDFANALALLRAHSPDDVLPESDGLSAARLREIITALRSSRGLTTAAGGGRSASEG